MEICVREAMFFDFLFLFAEEDTFGIVVSSTVVNLVGVFAVLTNIDTLSVAAVALPKAVKRYV